MDAHIWLYSRIYDVPCVFFLLLIFIATGTLAYIARQSRHVVLVDVSVRIELATFDFTSFDSCYLYNQAGVCGDGTCQIDDDGERACDCPIGFGGEFCADSTSTSESLDVHQ